MPDIHSPSISSSRTLHGATNGITPRQSLPELISTKERLEAELSALGAVLDSHGVNMNTSLLTFDGFPRADIDVAQIRTTRARIITLKNDHKAIMKKIEEAVHEQFSALKDGSESAASAGAPAAASSAPAASSNPSSAVSTSIAPVSQIPFAKVNTVSPGGPAEIAGLQAGDQISVFGSVNFTNHERLSRIPQVVQQNVNVLRQTAGSPNPTAHEFRLTPQNNWGGRGLLGCHILPL